MVCRSNAEAQRFAAFMKPIDEWAIIEVKGSTVTRYSAKSQSERAMGKVDFEASKNDVLNFAASLIGVTRPQLEHQGEMA
jgi:hypothetical protein